MTIDGPSFTNPNCPRDCKEKGNESGNCSKEISNNDKGLNRSSFGAQAFRACEARQLDDSIEEVPVDKKGEEVGPKEWGNRSSWPAHSDNESVGWNDESCGVETGGCTYLLLKFRSSLASDLNILGQGFVTMQLS